LGIFFGINKAEMVIPPDKKNLKRKMVSEVLHSERAGEMIATRPLCTPPVNEMIHTAGLTGVSSAAEDTVFLDSSSSSARASRLLGFPPLLSRPPPPRVWPLPSPCLFG
jgi:hypothetical protein